MPAVGACAQQLTCVHACVGCSDIGEARLQLQRPRLAGGTQGRLPSFSVVIVLLGFGEVTRRWVSAGVPPLSRSPTTSRANHMPASSFWEELGGLLCACVCVRVCLAGRQVLYTAVRLHAMSLLHGPVVRVSLPVYTMSPLCSVFARESSVGMHAHTLPPLKAAAGNMHTTARPPTGDPCAACCWLASLLCEIPTPLVLYTENQPDVRCGQQHASCDHATAGLVWCARARERQVVHAIQGNQVIDCGHERINESSINSS